MDMHKFYAHSVEGKPVEQWQPLEEHLRNVAERARRFAEPFGTGEWAYLAGLWHDLGKYSDEFQAYLLRENGFEAHIENVPGRVDHSTAGAKHAVKEFGLLGHLLAYMIAGHHSGLLDGYSETACQKDRLDKNIQVPSNAPDEIRKCSSPQPSDFLKRALARRDGFAVSFFVRMIFSCLVDADFLDTERVMNPKQWVLREHLPDNILDLMEHALDAHMDGFSLTDAPVNADRAAVRLSCLEKAVLPPGFFSLTVPTGGGKTLSSLAFALRHAREHRMDRIVYVVPFTSIIEQNAQEFRKVMEHVEGIPADRIVVEHHSNFDPDKETPYSRLACENWDAPLIVTTAVQFYESLLANRTSACRKLHNLSKAVIILDEAQTIPVDYLQPCLCVLKELTENYGSTVVLCTATQPAIHQRDDFRIGIENVREIMPDPHGLHSRLKRVSIVNIGRIDDKDIIGRIKNEKQVLCVVNTVGHAQNLTKALGKDEGHFHLTAAKCPEHRSQTLDVIRHRLDRGLRCRVVSTQLIEAGVDVDFPVVYRSLAGLDSIVQSAGRCNRNGRSPSHGRVYIFRSEHQATERFIADTVGCAGQVLDIHQDDPLALAAMDHYFRLYYWDQTSRWDSKDIIRAFNLAQDFKFPFLFNFVRASQDFRLIQNNTRPVIVPWGEKGGQLCEKLEKLPSLNRDIARRLQRYTVHVRERVWFERLDRGLKQLFDGSIAVLTCPEMYYSKESGLHFEDPSGEALFV